MVCANLGGGGGGELKSRQGQERLSCPYTLDKSAFGGGRQTKETNIEQTLIEPQNEGKSTRLRIDL